MTKLSAEQALYIDTLWREQRYAVQQYRKADAAWNKLNDELGEKWEREGLDDVAIAHNKTVNLGLASHLSAAGWWRDKATALSTVLLAEKAAMEMMKGDQGWEPASPVSRGRRQ